MSNVQKVSSSNLDVLNASSILSVNDVDISQAPFYVDFDNNIKLVSEVAPLAPGDLPVYEKAADVMSISLAKVAFPSLLDTAAPLTPDTSLNIDASKYGINGETMVVDSQSPFIKDFYNITDVQNTVDTAAPLTTDTTLGIDASKYGINGETMVVDSPPPFIKDFYNITDIQNTVDTAAPLTPDTTLNIDASKYGINGETMVVDSPPPFIKDFYNITDVQNTVDTVAPTTSMNNAAMNMDYFKAMVKEAPFDHFIYMNDAPLNDFNHAMLNAHDNFSHDIAALNALPMMYDTHDMSHAFSSFDMIATYIH